MTSLVVVFCRVRAQGLFTGLVGQAIHHRTLPRPPGQLPFLGLFRVFGESEGDGKTVIVRDCTTVSEGMCLPLGPRNISAANTKMDEVGYKKRK